MFKLAFAIEIVDLPQLDSIELPFLMSWIGGVFIIIFCFSFLRLIQLKIDLWNHEKLSPLPLENFQSITYWIGILAGLTIMFTGVLQVFNFSLINSLISSLILGFLTGIPMWNVVKQLLSEIETGTIKEIDKYF